MSTMTLSPNLQEILDRLTAPECDVDALDVLLVVYDEMAVHLSRILAACEPLEMLYPDELLHHGNRGQLVDMVKTLSSALQSVEIPDSLYRDDAQKLSFSLRDRGF